MHGNNQKTIANFYVVGLNYRKTDAAIRGQFAVSDQQYVSILAQASIQHLDELFILSTCNRTEIYGFAAHPDQLIGLICSGTNGNLELFRERCYIKNGSDAVEHLFSVGAGLDSQLLGDYEIVGQLKTAVRFAKQNGSTGSFTERLVNCVLQASKNIKNQTKLSGGTVSVSFAAVEYIRETIKNIADKKILLLGIGKMGTNTGKNLSDYLGTKNITLINRNPEKAIELATELGLKYAPFEELIQHLQNSDIIVVATNAEHPLVFATQLEGQGEKLIIDLSIPCNVEAAVAELPGVCLVNVDELSKLKDNTLRQRESEVPKAKQILAEHIIEFKEWYDMRRHVPVLKAVKTKLLEINSDPFFLPLYKHNVSSNFTDQKIQRVINGMAFKMKTVNQKGCHYIEAINEFIATGS
jgi:glutamyl-tRNA reductase